MIVECMGLPGSGKTYLANQIVAGLKLEGYSAVNFVDRSRHHFFYRVLFWVLRKNVIINQFYRSIRQEYSKCIGEMKDVYNTGLNDYYLTELVVYKILYSRFVNAKKYYIFDEGILHMLASISALYGVERENLLFPFKDIKQECARIYVRTSVDDSIKSIKQRDRHECEMDEFSDSELEKYISDFYSEVEYYSKREFVYVVDKYSDLEEFINYIISNVLTTK